MQNKQSETTLVTLANAAELVRHIVQGIVGNEVADTLNGSPLTRQVIYDFAQSEFQSSVAKYLGGK